MLMDPFGTRMRRIGAILLDSFIISKSIAGIGSTVIMKRSYDKFHALFTFSLDEFLILSSISELWIYTRYIGKVSPFCR